MIDQNSGITIAHQLSTHPRPSSRLSKLSPHLTTSNVIYAHAVLDRYSLYCTLYLPPPPPQSSQPAGSRFHDAKSSLPLAASIPPHPTVGILRQCWVHSSPPAHYARSPSPGTSSVLKLRPSASLCNWTDLTGISIQLLLTTPRTRLIIK